MHIPDGYLSPSTCAAAAAAAAPAWLVAAGRLRRRIAEREAPMLAAGAAFSFVLMMLNVPVPGGTTAHAVGGTLIAVILGPDAAILSMAVTLVIQALFFGDGGVLALGANCLNMGVILPLSGYTVYRALSASNGRRGPWLSFPLAAACGAYVGINLAALAAACELGIQPVLFHTASGAPLYCPYQLSQTIPAMALAHLTVAGGVEAAVTGMVVAYLRHFDPATFTGQAETSSGAAAWAWRGVAALLVLAPLGLLASGSAFGEWSDADLKKLIGFVPAGLAHYHEVWTHAPLPGYGLPGGPAGAASVPGSWLSAIAGVLLIAAAAWCVMRLLGARNNRSPAAQTLLRSGSSANRAHSSFGRAPGWSGQSLQGAELPGWMTELPDEAAPLHRSGRKRQISFVEKTLAGTAAFVQGTVFAEAISRQPGMLQRLNPRIRLLAFAAALFTACSLRSLPLLLALVTAAAVVSVQSGVSPALLVRRFGIIPAWTALAALPAVLNCITPGTPILIVARWAHPPPGLPAVLCVTQPGVLGALVLVVRVTACVWLGALLTLTSRWEELLSALRECRAPRLFVFVLAMVYRYLFLLLQLADDLFTARRSRMVSHEGVSGGREFVAAAASYLFGKSRALSEEVYLAMISRGYRGEPRSLPPAKASFADRAWLIACLGFLLICWIGDRIHG